MKKKGISLITLIVTIVVIIILAAIVILSMRDNETAEQAKWAAFVQEMTTVYDAVMLDLQSNAEDMIAQMEYTHFKQRLEFKDRKSFVTKVDNIELPETLIYDLLYVREGRPKDKEASAKYYKDRLQEIYDFTEGDEPEDAIYIVNGDTVGGKWNTYLFDMKTETAFKIPKTKIFKKIFHHYDSGDQSNEYITGDEDHSDSCKITFDDNGGTNGPGVQYKPKGKTIQITSVIPEREDALFVNWKDKNSDAVFYPGTPVRDDICPELIAQWREGTGPGGTGDDKPIVDTDIFYYINYNANGGTNIPPRQKIPAYTETYINTSVIPNRPGYSFLGWSTTANAQYPEYTIDNPPKLYVSDNIDLYAVWGTAYYIVDDITPYETFASAIDSPETHDGSIIKVLSDFTDLSSGTIAKNVTLDLNGHNLKRNSQFTVNEGYEFTIIGEGTLECTSAKAIENNGIFNLGIDEGAVSEAPHIIGASNGVFNYNTFNMNDGTVTGAVAAVIGGVTSTPNSYNPVATEGNGVQDVTLKITTEAAARIDMKYFETLDAAIAVAQSIYQPIYVLKNIQVTKAIEIAENKNILIDLNGYTIQNVGNVNTIINNGNLSLRDTSKNKTGTVKNINTIAIISNDRSSLTINSGNYETTASNTNTIIANGNLDITDCNLKSTGSNSNGLVVENGTKSTSITGGNYSATNRGIQVRQLREDSILKNFTVNNLYIHTGAKATIQNVNVSVKVTNYSGTLEMIDCNVNSTSNNAVEALGNGTLKLTNCNVITSGNNTVYSDSNTSNYIEIIGGSYKNTASIENSYSTIHVLGGQLKIDGATITTSTNKDPSYPFNHANVRGIYHQNTEIDLNNVTINANIGVYGDTTDNVSTVKIQNSTINSYVCEIYNERSILEITNVDIKPTFDVKQRFYDSSSYYYYGIFNNIGYVTLNNVNIDVKVTSSNSDYSCYGVYNTNGQIYISDDCSVVLTKYYLGSVTKAYGAYNAGTNGEIILGKKDKEINSEKPYIRADNYGLVCNVGRFRFFDGKLQGATSFEGYFYEIEEKSEIKTTSSNDIETTQITNRVTKVAKNLLNNVSYTSLEEALESVPEGTEDMVTIQMLRDAYLLEDITIPDNKKVKLDLNMKTIRTGKNIVNEGTLEITDSDQYNRGKILGSKENLIQNKMSGKLEVSGGTIELTAGNTTIYNEGKIKITGGEVKYTGSTSRANVINNSGFDEIEITGGLIQNNVVPGYGIYNNQVADINMSGGKIVTYSNIGESSKTDDLAAIRNGFGGNITLSGTAEISSSKTTDRSLSRCISNMSSGTITIKDQVKLSSYDTIFQSGVGTINITGVTIAASRYLVYQRNANNSTINIEDSIINASQAYYNDYYGVVNININNSTINGSGQIGYGDRTYFVFDVKDSYINNSSIYGIISGTFENTEIKRQGSGYNAPIVAFANSNFTLRGCTVEGIDGISCSASNVTCNLENTTINASLNAINIPNTNATVNLKDSIINTNITSTSGTAYGIYNNSNATINIKGNSQINAIATGINNTCSTYGIYNKTGIVTVGEKDKIVEDYPKIVAKTKGLQNDNGVFNFYDGEISGVESILGTVTEIEENCEVIKTVDDNKIETARIKQGLSDVVQVGETKYTSIKLAVEAIEESEEQVLMTVLEDHYIKELIVIPEGKNIKLDLNGKRLVGSLDDQFEIKGKFEITDSNIDNEGKIETAFNRLINVTSARASFTFSGGNLIQTNPSSNNTIFTNIILTKGDLNITGGVLEQQKNGFSRVIETTSDSSVNVKVTGGLINIPDGTYYQCGIFNNGTSILEMSGGKINLPKANSSYYKHWSDAIYYSSACIKNLSSGKLTISGDANLYAGATSSSSSNGAYVIHACTTTNDIEILGGTFSAKYTIIQVASGGSGTIKIDNATLSNAEYAIAGDGSFDIEIKDSSIDTSYLINHSNNITLNISDSSVGRIYGKNINGTISNSQINAGTNPTAFSCESGEITFSNTDVSAAVKAIENRGNASIKIKDNCKINVNGYRQGSSGSQLRAIQNSAGTIEIENSIISVLNPDSDNYTYVTQCYAIYNDTGNVTIKGDSSIIANNEKYVTNLKLAEYARPYLTAIHNEAGNVTIGEDDGVINTEQPLIAGLYRGIVNNGNLYFYDGKITATTALVGAVTGIPSDTEFVRETDEVTSVETAYLGTESLSPVAEVTIGETTTEYYSIKEAVEAVPNSNTPVTIKVIKDHYYTESTTITSKKNIKLDLNGKKIIASKPYAFINEGTFEITDSSTEEGVVGKIESGYDQIVRNKAGCTFTLSGGKLILTKGGTSWSNYTRIIYSEGNVVIHGGSGSMDVSGYTRLIELAGNAKLTSDNFNFSYSGGEYKTVLYNGGKGNIEITGGNSVVYINKAYANVIENMSTGNVILGGNFSLNMYRNQNGSVAIQNNSTGKITIKDQASITGSGVQNIIYNASTAPIEITSTGLLKAEFNNYYSGYGEAIYLKENATVTIQNANLYGVKYCINANKNADITITDSNLSVYATAAGTSSPIALNLNGGTLNLTNTSISGCAAIYKSTGTLTITDCTISATAGSGIRLNGDTTLNLEGTTTIEAKNQGIYLTSGNQTVNMNATSVSGEYYGIYNDGYGDDKINIISGNVTGTNKENSYGIYCKKNSNSVPEIVLGTKGTPVSTDSPVITGTVYGIYTEEGVKFKYYDGKLKGITYPLNGLITELEPNYQLRLSAEGDYQTNTLELSGVQVTVASIGSVEYDTIQAAVNACEANVPNTILIKRGMIVTESVIIPSNKIITIDLNGKTLSSESIPVIVNNGTLTITDGSSSREGLIRSTSGAAIDNKGTLNIGINDTIVNMATPTIKGGTNGVLNAGTVNFYDGKISGNPPVSTSITETPNGYTTTTTTIDSVPTIELMPQ